MADERAGEAVGIELQDFGVRLRDEVGHHHVAGLERDRRAGSGEKQCDHAQREKR
jgi:hypothetical protein